jgi:hypothetical protein
LFGVASTRSEFYNWRMAAPTQQRELEILLAIVFVILLVAIWFTLG